MKKLIPFVLACIALACNTANNANKTTLPSNTLSLSEKNSGWQLLFNGNTITDWHTYGKTGIGTAWKVNDNALHLDAASKKQQATGGDIVTNEDYENFHFKYDWKIAKNGNSGVMFYVQEDTAKYKYTFHTGPEMQVVDNDGHPDAKNIKHRAADLYDLIAAKETVHPAGEWNRAEIISNNGDLTFILNGEQVLHTTMWNDNWRSMIANSKFKSMKGFGVFKTGKIALQDHGDDVWYRNLKIKRL